MWRPAQRARMLPGAAREPAHTSQNRAALAALAARPPGNLDGGVGTAAHVRDVLAAAGAATSGDRAVRLSLDEAFFMVHALNILTVHEEGPGGGAAVRLDTTVSEAAGRREHMLCVHRVACSSCSPLCAGTPAYTARPPARRLQAHLFLHLSPSEVRQQAVPLEFMHWYPMEARFKLMHRSLPPLHLSTQSV